MTEDQCGKKELPVAQFVREHSFSLIGLLPVLIAGLDLLMVSGGNPQVLGYIVRGMSISAIVFGVFIPLIPFVLVMTVVPWFIWRTGRGREQNVLVKYTSDIGALTVAIIVFATCAIIWLLTFAFSMIVAIAIAAVAVRKRRAQQLRYGADAAGQFRLIADRKALARILFPMTFLAYLFAFAQNWLPHELVSIENGSTYTAQVLSSDRDWTVLLKGERLIEIVHTADIKSRQACLKRPGLTQYLVTHTLRTLTQSPAPPCKESG